MFIIDPTEHNNYKKLLKPFLDHIKNNSRFRWAFQDHKKATFILSLDKSKGIYGGAVLLKHTDEVLPKSIQRNMLDRGSVHKDIWICTLFLCKEENYSPKNGEFFYETFYRVLYKKLIEFGMKENISFLYTMLEPGDYLCTEALGCWPYAFELKSYESLDGLCYNILSLTNSPLQFRTKHGATMGRKEIKLAA